MQIFDLMLAGKVARYHTTPTPQPQTVAAHSWGVALILYAIAGDELSHNLIRAALCHDTAEYWLGDIPAPTKECCPEIAEAIDREQIKVDKRNGVNVPLSENEKFLLDIADHLERVYFSLHQISVGNKFYMPILFSNIRLLEDLKTYWPRTVHDLMAEIMEHAPASQFPAWAGHA